LIQGYQRLNEAFNKSSILFLAINLEMERIGAIARRMISRDLHPRRDRRGSREIHFDVIRRGVSRVSGGNKFPAAAGSLRVSFEDRN
jgi:hypothetical protein